MNLIEAARLSDAEARKYLESLRWPNGPVCPHCQSQDVTRMQGKAHRSGTIQCNACREQFTVTVGTVMESSKVCAAQMGARVSPALLVKEGLLSLPVAT